MKPSQSQQVAVVLAPVTAATTARTASIDTAGADYATIYISASAEANTNSTNVALNLRESDSTAATTFATFNSSLSVTLDNTAAAVQPFHVDLKGRKRYLQVVVTPDTTTNGAVITSCLSVLTTEIQSTSSSIAVRG